jgi:hypothetical protein
MPSKASRSEDFSTRSYRLHPGNARALIESITEAYDPDHNFAPRMMKNPVVAFSEHIEAKADKNCRLPKDYKGGVERANIIEVNRFGAYRIRSVEGTEGVLQAMREAKAKEGVLRKIVEVGIKMRPAATFTEAEVRACNKLSESAKFREDFDLSCNDNNAYSGNPFDEYIPIMGGPFSHALYLHDFLDMMAKTFEAWNHSPYAHQIVRVQTCFVLGRGVTFQARHPLVQQAFMRWWHANDMDGRIEVWNDMLTRDGALMVRRFVNPINREMFLRWIDPSTIWEIVTDIEDIEREYYYHQQYPAAYQVLYGKPAGGRFDPMNFESSKYIINQIPADEVYHVKINCSPNEKRGRSDLFCILGWLKRHKDFQTGIVLKNIVQSVFAWKNKIKGSQTDVDAFVSAFGTAVPNFGSLWTENESSELTPMVADVKSGANLPDAPGIVSTIAVGAGTAKEYLGASEAGTRATAVIASEPSAKKYQSRQLLLGRFLTRIAEDWFENEVEAGRLPKYVTGEDNESGVVFRWLQKAATRFPALAKPTGLIISAMSGATPQIELDGHIDFMFPEIAVEDRSAKIADLTAAKDQRVIDHERFCVAVAKELGIQDYEYADAQAKIAEDEAQALGGYYQRPGGDEDAGDGGEQPPKAGGGLSGQERKDVKANDRR